MDIFKEISPLRAYLHAHRSESIGLVPTMGALHEGHLQLVRQSRRDNSITVCTIYVNPTQFNNPADLEKYPRSLEADSRLLEAEGCDVLFCPEDSEMYPGQSTLTMQVQSVAGHTLEGAFRPGHFNGVALVVAKLFNIVRPARAYFGLKDYQQVVVIRQLIAELKFDLELVTIPISREADGLARSSRNRRLNQAERQNAPALYESLVRMKQQLIDGAAFQTIKQEAVDYCLSRNVRIEYVELVDRDTLVPLGQGVDPRKGILLIAGYVGEVRLIDNLMVDAVTAVDLR